MPKENWNLKISCLSADREDLRIWVRCRGWFLNRKIEFQICPGPNYYDQNTYYKNGIACGRNSKGKTINRLILGLKENSF
jgi:hypothetical protein